MGATLLRWQVCFKAADTNAKCVLSSFVVVSQSVSQLVRPSDGQWPFYAHAHTHAAYVVCATATVSRALLIRALVSVALASNNPDLAFMQLGAAISYLLYSLILAAEVVDRGMHISITQVPPFYLSTPLLGVVSGYEK